MRLRGRVVNWCDRIVARTYSIHKLSFTKPEKDRKLQGAQVY